MRTTSHPHIQHMLLDTGLSHMQATCLLVLVNMLIVTATIVFHRWGTSLLLLLEISHALLVSAWLRKLTPLKYSGRAS
ncbi:MAG: hypothetical protein EP344_15585 [Bacteroidetes bacterium]|nr:MAG: hypothetical protein EP344_15585 [Bacteroidota bacterium]